MIMIDEFKIFLGNGTVSDRFYERLYYLVLNTIRKKQIVIPSMYQETRDFRENEINFINGILIELLNIIQTNETFHNFFYSICKNDGHLYN